MLAPVTRARRFRQVMAAVACIAGLSCSDVTPPTPPTGTPQVKTVAVAAASPTLASLGDTLRFTATARDSSGNVLADRPVAWSSSNAAVASIGGDGVATAVANGTTTVTAVVDGVVGRLDLTVSQVATSLDVTPTSVKFTSFGDTVRLRASGTDARGNPLTNITWTSVTPSRVAVDSTGLATAISTGAATIVVKAGIARLVQTDVTQIPASYRMGPTTFVFTSIGETVQFRDSVFDARGNLIERPRATSWGSTNPASVTISPDGVATAKAIGTTTITARTTGFSRSGVMRVTQYIVPTRLTTVAGAILDDMRTAVQDARGNPVPVTGTPTWTSADPTIADVMPDGRLTAKKTGTVRITGTTAEFTQTVDLIVGSALGDTVRVNTTLPRGAYSVTSRLVVPPGIRLKIEAGAELRFAPEASLVVNGALEAIGTATDTIRFAPSSALPVNGTWGGITFGAGSVAATYGPDTSYQSGSIIAFADIGYGKPIILAAGGPYIANSHIHHLARLSDPSSGALTLLAGNTSVIRRNEIEDNAMPGIATSGAPLIQRNLIRRNGDITATAGFQGMAALAASEGGGILVASGKVVIEDNRITDNRAGYRGAGIALREGAIATIRYNNITDNVLFALDGGGGSAVAARNDFGAANTTMTLSYNTIENNSCRVAPSYDCVAVAFGARGSMDHNNLVNGYPEVAMSLSQVTAPNNWWNSTSPKINCGCSDYPGILRATAPLVMDRIPEARPRAP
jgi:uncharacterized protein YjdB